MAGTTTWELYYIEKGNPKDGTVVDQGTIPKLAAGEVYRIESTVTQPGNYMFKAYQRPGHGNPQNPIDPNDPLKPIWSDGIEWP